MRAWSQQETTPGTGPSGQLLGVGVRGLPRAYPASEWVQFLSPIYRQDMEGQQGKPLTQEGQVLNPGQGSKAPGVQVLVAARGPSDMPVGRPTPLPSPPRTRWDLQQPQLARLTPIPLPPPFILYHRARVFSSFHTSHARGWADRSVTPNK